MPICIILDPLNWTRPDLIHIEGDRHRHDARAPESPEAEEASAQGGSPLPDQPAAAPQPEGMAQKGGSWASYARACKGRQWTWKAQWTKTLTRPGSASDLVARDAVALCVAGVA